MFMNFFFYLDLIQILERREVRRWKKALKAEPGLMLCGKRIVQHCDRFGHTCSSCYCFLLFLLLTLKLFALLLMLISLVLRLSILCCDRFFCCFSSFCSLCYNTYINRITFTKISCSSNGDTSISQTEWTSCLGVSKGEI